MLPPGPKRRFLIGNFPFGTRDPLGLLTSWARQYGDIFYYRALHFRVYFLNHPDYIESVLVTNSRNFIKGRGLQANRRVFGNGLLTSEGDFWLRQRRLAQPAFHRDRIAAYGGVMVAYAERMLGAWREGETRDVHQDMMRLTLEIVAKALFNAEVAGEVEEVGAALEVLMEQNSGGRMLLPLLRSLPTPGNLRYRRAVRRLDEIVYAIIRKRRASDHDAGDLLSMLLDAQDEDGSRMTDRQLRDEALTLILAGHETTAISLSWTWYLLAQHPEVEANLWRELDEVLGGRAPSVDDLPRLPYTEMVVKESMRLYPPAYAMARMARQDCEIAGYRVHAGSSLVMSQWVMHRDPRYYQEPETFNPDRWAGDLAKRLPKFAYFPFGGGPRLCIGAPFAMMETVLLLATIAQRYRLSLAPGHPVEPLPTITLRPKYGIKVVLHGR
jgi:cytochrome P450